MTVSIGPRTVGAGRKRLVEQFIAKNSFLLTPWCAHFLTLHRLKHPYRCAFFYSQTGLLQATGPNGKLSVSIESAS